MTPGFHYLAGWVRRGCPKRCGVAVPTAQCMTQVLTSDHMVIAGMGVAILDTMKTDAEKTAWMSETEYSLREALKDRNAGRGC